MQNQKQDWDIESEKEKIQKIIYDNNVVYFLKTIREEKGLKELNRILGKYDFGDFSLSEIAKIIGTSVENTRQLEKVAIRKLKSPSFGGLILKSLNEEKLEDETLHDFGDKKII